MGEKKICKLARKATNNKIKANDLMGLAEDLPNKIIVSAEIRRCHQLAETINRVEKISAAEKKTIQVSQTSLRVCMEDTISNYEPFISLG